jgi:hypothetical protein
MQFWYFHETLPINMFNGTSIKHKSIMEDIFDV